MIVRERERERRDSEITKRNEWRERECVWEKVRERERKGENERERKKIEIKKEE